MYQVLMDLVKIAHIFILKFKVKTRKVFQDAFNRLGLIRLIF